MLHVSVAMGVVPSTLNDVKIFTLPRWKMTIQARFMTMVHFKVNSL